MATWGEQLLLETETGSLGTNENVTAVTSVESEIQQLLQQINQRAGKNAIEVKSSPVTDRSGKNAHLFWCSVPKPMIDSAFSGRGLFRGMLTAVEKGGYSLEPLPVEYASQLVRDYDPGLKYFWIYKK